MLLLLCSYNRNYVEEQVTFTLRNRSFSLAVASLDCIKLCKAIFAAGKTQERFKRDVERCWSGRQRTEQDLSALPHTFSLLLGAWSELDFIPFKSKGSVSQGRRRRTLPAARRDLLVVVHGGVGSADGNGEEQNVLGVRLPRQRVQQRLALLSGERSRAETRACPTPSLPAAPQGHPQL